MAFSVPVVPGMALPQEEYTFDGMQGSCNICNNFLGVGFTSPQLKEQHLAGSKHKKQKNVWEHMRRSQTNPNVGTVPSMNGSSTRTIGSISLDDVTTALSKINVNDSATNHKGITNPAGTDSFSSPMPNEDIEPYIKCVDPVCDQYRCLLCDDIPLISGMLNVQQHLLGRKHLRNVGYQTSYSTPANMASTRPPSDVGAHPPQLSRSSPTQPNAISSAGSVSVPYTTAPVHSNSVQATTGSAPQAEYSVINRLKCQYMCNACHIQVSGDTNLEQHLQGAKHIKLKARLALSQSSSGVHLPGNVTNTWSTSSGTDGTTSTSGSSSNMSARASGSETPRGSSQRLQVFERLEKIGSGSYGVVYAAIHKLDKHKYALKQTPMKASCEEKRILREVEALANLNHKHIVRYYDAWWTDGDETNEDLLPASSSAPDIDIVFDNAASNPHSNCSKPSFGLPLPSSSSTNSETFWMQSFVKRPAIAHLWIQMELCHKGTLGGVLEKYARNPQKSCLLGYFTQITEAVAYIHDQNLIHRDLKPANILFSSDDTVKVGDFGLAKENQSMLKSSSSLTGATAAQRHTGRVGTPLYRSPEQADKGASYDEKADMYPLGLMLVEILLGFKTKSETIQVLDELRHNPNTLPDVPRDYFEHRKLVMSLISHDPCRRLSAKELLNKLDKCTIDMETNQLQSCPPIVGPF